MARTFSVMGISVSGNSSAVSSDDRERCVSGSNLRIVAEEVDADGAVHFGRVDVDDAAAQGDLAEAISTTSTLV